jgi:hypothetical protein
MPTTDTHALLPAVKISHPGGKDGFYTVSCSHGDYTSSPAARENDAIKSGTAHVTAKNIR